MRTLTADQTHLYGLNHRQTFMRVRVEDGDGTLRDLSTLTVGTMTFDLLVSATIDDSTSQMTATASVEVRRARRDISVATDHETSALNLNAAGAFDRLIDIGREIVIDVQIRPIDSDVEATWTEVFRGKIDTVDSASDPMTIEARDLGAVPKDRYIETENSFGSAGGVAIETVLQAILDDVLGAAVITLEVDGVPSWALLTFSSERQPLLDQLQLLADQIAWTVKYRFNEGSGLWELTLYEIDRASSTSLHTFGPSQYQSISTMERSITDIRNACTVRFTSSTAKDTDGNPATVEVTAENAASITRFGRRWIGITEDSSSNIGTTIEATRMANAVVDDLANPTIDAVVVVGFFHAVEVGDLYTFEADAVRFTEDRDMAVVGWSHNLSSSSVTTALTVRGDQPVGRGVSWLKYAAAKGLGAQQDANGPVETAAVLTRPGIGDITAVHPSTRSQSSRFEVHIGPPGFVPDTSFPSSTLWGITSANETSMQADDGALHPMGEERDVRMRPVDRHGNRGLFSGAITSAALRAGSQFLTPDDRWGMLNGSAFNTSTRGSLFPPDFWSMDVGTWATDANTSTSNSRTGQRVIVLEGTAVATALISDLVPVTPQRRYTIQVEWRADSVTPPETFDLELDWLEADQSTLVQTDVVHSELAGAVDTYETIYARVQPPSAARWARLRVAKGNATTYEVLIDRVQWDEFEAVASLTPNGLHGVGIFDDFIGSGTLGGGSIGSEAWDSHPVNSSSLTISRPGVAQLTNEEQGVIRLGASGSGGQRRGGTISLGTLADPMTVAPIRYGVEDRYKVRLPGIVTNMTAWVGMWSDETEFPDSGGLNTNSGIGVRSETVSAAATNWFGVVRDGTSETTVDLGVLGDDTFHHLGWRRTSSGVQFMIDGEDVGAEATTNLPASGVALSPIAGLVATGGDDREIDLDWYSHLGAFRR